jgi:hypothetical protein
MRARAFAVVASLALSGVVVLPLGVSAQIGRAPRPATGRTLDPIVPNAVPLPKEAPPISRALAYKRSRWAFESYTLLNSVQVPSGNGVSTQQSFGAGVHGDYRYTDNFSFTADLTSAAISNPTSTVSAEIGTRYAMLPLDRTVRPFFDLRGAYLRSYDAITSPGQVISSINSPDYTVTSRYGRGFGAGAGAGLEIALTHSLSMTTELVALRSRMTAYDSSNPVVIPQGSHFWTTTARYVLGFRYSPVRVAHLVQNPNS